MVPRISSTTAVATLPSSVARREGAPAERRWNRVNTWYASLRGSMRSTSCCVFFCSLRAHLRSFSEQAYVCCMQAMRLVTRTTTMAEAHVAASYCYRLPARFRKRDSSQTTTPDQDQTHHPTAPDLPKPETQQQRPSMNAACSRGGRQCCAAQQTCTAVQYAVHPCAAA